MSHSSYYAWDECHKNLGGKDLCSKIYNSIKKHKRNKNFFYLICYFVVSLVLFLICLYFQITSFYTVNLYESNQNSKIYGDLRNGQVIIQEFISPLDSFQKIGLQIATYKRNGIDGKIFASVYVNNEKRNEQIISGKSVSDWCWIDIDIDGQVKKGDVIKLEISLRNKEYPIALMVHDTKNEKSVIKINESTKLNGITNLRVSVKRDIQLAWLFWIIFNLVFIFVYLFLKGNIIKKVEVMLILLCFFSCLIGALFTPVNQCPDEFGRVMLSQWMIKNHTLPTGNEIEVIMLGPGFSYALRPFLSSMVGALFQSLVAVFTSAPSILLAASRICSVVSVTLCCWFCLRLGHRCFSGYFSSFLFAAFVCFLPQVQFLGFYQNNDALSLCAVSAMLCFLAEGFDNQWHVRSCVKLAIALSVGALSYYWAYPWFLMGIIFCVLSVVRNREIPDKTWFILRRGGLVVAICLVLAGWFFVRNAMLHQGDFLGLAEEQRSRVCLAERGYDVFDSKSAKDSGKLFLPFYHEVGDIFTEMTIRSIFGYFGYMNIVMPDWLYLAYYFLSIAGIINLCLGLYLKKPSCVSFRNCFLVAIGATASVITIALHIWMSYARDFQPQGRYIITVVLFLGFLITLGIDRLQVSTNGKIVLREIIPLVVGLVWIALYVCAEASSMEKMLF